MHFAALPYLYLLSLIPALLALYIYARRRKRQALTEFVDASLAPRLLSGFSRTRQWLKILCLAGAVGCLVLALMQPQWGTSQEDVSRRGRDLIILLDISLSMLAEDAEPNRLEGAKNSIKELVEAIRQEGGHRLGLVTFAGRASLQCPLTLDYTFFLQRLAEVSTETVIRKGTLIGDAIRQALQGFGTLDFRYTDIILITDGEDHDSFPLEAAKIASAQQVSLYTIGIGDPRQGAPIPVKNADGERGYLQYQDQEVRSRMRQNLLSELAQLTGGAHVAAGTGPIELDRIYREYIASKERRYLDATTSERLVHRYHWFVLAALLLLALEMLIRERTNG